MGLVIVKGVPWLCFGLPTPLPTAPQPAQSRRGELAPWPHARLPARWILERSFGSLFAIRETDDASAMGITLLGDAYRVP